MFQLDVCRDLFHTFKVESNIYPYLIKNLSWHHSDDRKEGHRVSNGSSDWRCMPRTSTPYQMQRNNDQETGDPSSCTRSPEMHCSPHSQTGSRCWNDDPVRKKHATCPQGVRTSQQCRQQTLETYWVIVGVCHTQNNPECDNKCAMSFEGELLFRESEKRSSAERKEQLGGPSPIQVTSSSAPKQQDASFILFPLCDTRKCWDEAAVLSLKTNILNSHPPLTSHRKVGICPFFGNPNLHRAHSANTRFLQFHLWHGTVPTKHCTWRACQV